MTFGALSFVSSCSGEEKKDEHKHEHAAMYQCPMKCEGDKTYENAGTCPKCNMNLEEVKDHEDGHEH